MILKVSQQCYGCVLHILKLLKIKNDDIIYGVFVSYHFSHSLILIFITETYNNLPKKLGFHCVFTHAISDAQNFLFKNTQSRE